MCAWRRLRAYLFAGRVGVNVPVADGDHGDECEVERGDVLVVLVGVFEACVVEPGVIRVLQGPDQVEAARAVVRDEHDEREQLEQLVEREVFLLELEVVLELGVELHDLLKPEQEDGLEVLVLDLEHADGQQIEYQVGTQVVVEDLLSVLDDVPLLVEAAIEVDEHLQQENDEGPREQEADPGRVDFLAERYQVGELDQVYHDGAKNNQMPDDQHRAVGLENRDLVQRPLPRLFLELRVAQQVAVLAVDLLHVLVHVALVPDDVVVKPVQLLQHPPRDPLEDGDHFLLDSQNEIQVCLANQRSK